MGGEADRDLDEVGLAGAVSLLVSAVAAAPSSGANL
jgi:hypothetical protein